MNEKHISYLVVPLADYPAKVIYRNMQESGVLLFWHFADREKLRQTAISYSGLYMFVNNYRIPDYIGVATDCRSRIMNHEKYTDQGILIFPCQMTTAKQIETILVARLKPVKNYIRYIHGKKGNRR